MDRRPGIRERVAGERVLGARVQVLAILIGKDRGVAGGLQVRLLTAAKEDAAAGGDPMREPAGDSPAGALREMSPEKG